MRGNVKHCKKCLYYSLSVCQLGKVLQCTGQSFSRLEGRANLVRLSTLHISIRHLTSLDCSWGEFCSNILPNIQLSALLSWSSEYSQCIKPHMITTDSLAPIHHSGLQSVLTSEFPLCWLLRAALLRCFWSNPSIHNKD